MDVVHVRVQDSAFPLRRSLNCPPRFTHVAMGPHKFWAQPLVHQAIFGRLGQPGVGSEALGNSRPPEYDFGCLIPKSVKNDIFVPSDFCFKQRFVQFWTKKVQKSAKIAFFWGRFRSFRDSNIIKHIRGACYLGQWRWTSIAFGDRHIATAIIYYNWLSGTCAVDVAFRPCNK